MESNSITYDRYSNPNSFDERELVDTIKDLEKCVNALQYKYVHLSENIEALSLRTKILIKHYNLEMANEESNFE